MSNVLARLSIESLSNLDLIPTMQDELFVGAKVEITVIDKGTFYGIISRLGSATLTLSKPMPIDVYDDEEIYNDKRFLTFDIADVTEVFAY